MKFRDGYHIGIRDRREQTEMNEMENCQKNRYHILFYGQVQGVGFRYRAYHAATALGLTGWVKNLWDESVEMEIQGDTEAIMRMVHQIEKSEYIGIRDVKWKKIPLESDSGFQIR